MGIILVAYSGYSMGQGDGYIVPGFGIFLGLSLVILSGLSVYGVCASSDKAIFIFFCIILTLTLFMIFVVICAFIFTGEAQSYVDGNWQEINRNFAGESKAQIIARIKQNLLAVAIISLFALIFMVTSLIYSSRVLGAARTQSRIMHLVNFLTLVLGVFIIVIAAITAFLNFSERVIPYILLFVGSSIFAISFFGYYGAKWKKSAMLFTYVVIVGLLTIMLLILGIICYAYKPEVASKISADWEQIKGDNQNSSSDLSNYIGKVSTYLTLLGTVAIGGVIFMLFAGTVGFLLANNIKHGDVDPDEPAPTPSTHSTQKL